MKAHYLQHVSQIGFYQPPIFIAVKAAKPLEKRHQGGAVSVSREQQYPTIAGKFIGVEQQMLLFGCQMPFDRSQQIRQTAYITAEQKLLHNYRGRAQVECYN